MKASNAAKIAISLPADLLEEVDRIKEERGVSRSAVVVEAVKIWLESGGIDARDLQYLLGYLKHPEANDNTAEVASAAICAWEPWE